jgi:hypothetical protein
MERRANMFKIETFVSVEKTYRTFQNFRDFGVKHQPKYHRLYFRFTEYDNLNGNIKHAIEAINEEK